MVHRRSSPRKVGSALRACPLSCMPSAARAGWRSSYRRGSSITNLSPHPIIAPALIHILDQARRLESVHFTRRAVDNGLNPRFDEAVHCLTQAPPSHTTERGTYGYSPHEMRCIHYPRAGADDDGAARGGA